MKKIISVILITVMLFSILAVTVCAKNGDLIWNPVSLRAGGGGSGGGGGGGSSGGSGRVSFARLGLGASANAV